MPKGAALALVQAGNDQYALAVALHGFGGGEGFVQRLGQRELAGFATELLEQDGGLHGAVFGLAKFLGFGIDLTEQSAFVDHSAGEQGALDAQFSGMHQRGAKEGSER